MIKGFTEFGANKKTKTGLLARCHTCTNTAKAVWAKNNKEKIKKASLQWARKNKNKKAEYYSKNKTKIRQQQQMYRQKNKEKLDYITKQWCIKNPEKRKKIANRYVKNNLAYYAARCAKRRSTKLRATPPWLTKAQHEEIADIYRQAKELEAIFFNRKFHVDHIIPLQGKDVCGLHVPWNLQILTAEENLAKGNKTKEIRTDANNQFN